ncbi:MAG: class I SAM-dependent methyltransferase, partial [Promethearchaeota archaeon]
MITIARIIALGIIITGVIVGFFLSWSLIKGAPWFPTRMKKVRKMLTLAEIQPGEIVYDLGCGDGRFTIIAARKYGAKAVGIEINLLLYLCCQFLITILHLRSRVKIVYGNLFKHDLSDADIVVCYLLQTTNDKLEEKLIKELKPTARIISNSFIFHKLRIVNEDIDNGIYV